MISDLVEVKAFREVLDGGGDGEEEAAALDGLPKGTPAHREHDYIPEEAVEVVLAQDLCAEKGNQREGGDDPHCPSELLQLRVCTPEGDSNDRDDNDVHLGAIERVEVGLDGSDLLQLEPGAIDHHDEPPANEDAYGRDGDRYSKPEEPAWWLTIHAHPLNRKYVLGARDRASHSSDIGSQGDPHHKSFGE